MDLSMILRDWFSLRKLLKVFGRGAGASGADAAGGNKSMRSSPDDEEEEAGVGVACMRGWKEAGDETADETDGGGSDEVREVDEGKRGFERAEAKRPAFAPSVAVKRSKAELNGCEACSVDDHKLALLIRVGEDASCSISGGEGEEKLQWVDVDKDGEEQGEVDPHGGRVMDAIAPEEVEMREPDKNE